MPVGHDEVHTGRSGPAMAVGLIAALIVGGVAVVALAPWSDPTDRGLADAGIPRTEDRSADPPPSQHGFPDARTTGVPDGTALTRSGALTVHEDGAVIENLLVIDGAIEVFANEVTIRNVRVTNQSHMLHWGISQGEGYGGLVVEDSEIFAGRDAPHKISAGIANHGGMITIRRVEIHSITDGIMTSHGLIEDSYLHSPRLFEGDHTDMIQAVGGSPLGLPLVIRGNTVINTEDQTGAVFLSDETGSGQVPVHHVLVEENLLAGGGFTVYGGGMVADGRDPRDIVIRNNTFSRDVWPQGGYWGPVTYFDPTAPGNTWVGNRWDDGTPVALD